MSDFFHLSQKIGRDLILVQGAGGNTSEKNGDCIVIKASGTALKDMTPLTSITCRLAPLEQYLFQEQHPTETVFALIVQKATDQKTYRGVPSLEIGLHVVLKKRYVFHTHHVYANIFTCMKNGKEYLQSLYQNRIVWIDYCAPGLALALALRNVSAPIIFLENHGIITQGTSPEECVMLIDEVTETIFHYIRSKHIPPFASTHVSANLSQHLFPDSVVYSQVDFSTLTKTKRAIYWDICSVHNFLLSAISRLGGKALFLSETAVAEIKNMEQEKYRVQQLHKM